MPPGAFTGPRHGRGARGHRSVRERCRCRCGSPGPRGLLLWRFSRNDDDFVYGSAVESRRARGRGLGAADAPPWRGASRSRSRARGSKSLVARDNTVSRRRHDVVGFDPPAAELRGSAWAAGCSGSVDRRSNDGPEDPRGAITRLDVHGGAELSTLIEVEELAARGHQVAVVDRRPTPPPPPPSTGWTTPASSTGTSMGVCRSRPVRCAG